MASTNAVFNHAVRAVNRAAAQPSAERAEEILGSAVQLTSSSLRLVSESYFGFLRIQRAGISSRLVLNLMRENRTLLDKVDTTSLQIKSVVADLRRTHHLWTREEVNLRNAVHAIRPDRDTVVRHMVDIAAIELDDQMYTSYLDAMEHHNLGLSCEQRDAVDGARVIHNSIWYSQPVEKASMLMELLGKARALGVKCPEAVVVELQLHRQHLPADQARLLDNFLGDALPSSWVNPRMMP